MTEPHILDYDLDAALAQLDAGDRVKGGTLCPSCGDWTDRHTRATHALHCRDLQLTSPLPATDARGRA